MIDVYVSPRSVGSSSRLPYPESISSLVPPHQLGSIRPIEVLEARIAPAFAAVVGLATLSGEDGFRMVGASEGDRFGVSVSSVGDINGDGIDDLIVGAYEANPTGTNTGAAYVFFGKTGAFVGDFGLSRLNGSNGFRITGGAEDDAFGFSVSAAGDVNGDGFDDVIVGAYRADGSAANTGAAYVLYGKGTAFAASISVNSLNGNNGFKINGAQGNDQIGFAVSSAGDFDGDGLDDLLIGSYGASPNGPLSGETYVVMGNAGGFGSSLDLSDLDGTNGFRISGVSANDRSGAAVSSAGDINGDGRDDLIIGAPTAPGGESLGETYVVYGTAGVQEANLDLSSLDGINGFKIIGELSQEQTGFSVGSAGDVNGDGLDDILVGAFQADPNGTDSGSAYLIFGSSFGFGSLLALSLLDGSNGFRMNGNGSFTLAGFSVSSAGDVNADSFDDILIGAPGSSHSAFVVLGHSGEFSPLVQLGALDGTNGFAVQGIPLEEGGRSARTIGDINGDSADDFIVGASRAQANGPDSGSAYIVFGQPGPPSLSIGDVTVLERGPAVTRATFTVTLSSPSTQSITVEYSTVAEGAEADVDFVPIISGMLTFAPGHTRQTISVTILNDNLREEIETFSVVLDSSVNAPILDAVGEATILDDDSPVEKSTSVVFRDIDGDQVTITLAGGKLEAGDIIFAADGTIETLDLTRFAAEGSDPASKPLNLTIGVKSPRGGTGDGLVQIGLINAFGVDLGTVKIFGDVERILGGDADFGKAAIRSLTISGSLGPLVAGESAAATELRGDVGSFNIRGGMRNASIEIDGAVGTIKIDGDLLGEGGMSMAGVQEFAETGNGPRIGGGLPIGAVVASSIKSFNVGGQVQGGAVSTAGDVGNVKVGGDMRNSSLVSGGVVRVVKIFGKLVSDDAAEPTIITALAKLSPDRASRAVGINALTVKGDVENARILVGYNAAGDGLNPDASIGKVSVGGNWKASSLASGVLDNGNDDFGINDSVIPEAVADQILARITSIVIRGEATGSSTPGDHFGIVAELISSVRINGIKIPLVKNIPDNILLDDVPGMGATTMDFRIVEVVRPTV